jgi:thiamine transport system permease protein
VRREIELPLMGRALGVAAAIAFAITLGEFGATVFVARADWPTLPVAVFRFLGRPGAENVGQAMALSVTLMALTVVVALAVERATAARGWRR